MADPAAPPNTAPNGPAVVPPNVAPATVAGIAAAIGKMPCFASCKVSPKNPGRSWRAAAKNPLPSFLALEYSVSGTLFSCSAIPFRCFCSSTKSSGEPPRLVAARSDGAPGMSAADTSIFFVAGLAPRVGCHCLGGCISSADGR